MGRFLKRPSPGTVIATVALFVALGSVAGALPGHNTVKNDDVKNLQYQNLNLKNGWSGFSGSYTPAAAIDAQGIVHLRGAIAQGINMSDNFARLPRALRPARPVTMLVDVAGVHPNFGELRIESDGQMTVSGPATQHKLYTSLDGVSFEG